MMKPKGRSPTLTLTVFPVPVGVMELILASSVLPAQRQGMRPVEERHEHDTADRTDPYSDRCAADMAAQLRMGLRAIRRCRDHRLDSHCSAAHGPDLVRLCYL